MHPLNPLSKLLTVNVPKKFPKVLNLLNFRITEMCKVYNLEFVDLSKKKIEMDWEESKLIRTKKVVVSSNPWTSDGVDYAVIAIQKGKLWFLKFGDEKWSAVDDPKQSHFDDCVYHKGKFYAVDHRGRTVVIGSDLRAEIAASLPQHGGGHYKHLVESCGDLFLVDKHLDTEEQVWYDDDEDEDSNLPIHLKIYKLNEEKKEWEWVKTLGDRVFFVGDDCSYCVSTQDFSGLRRDCIYFCDHMFLDVNEEDENLVKICGDTGVYSLDDCMCGALATFPELSQIFWPPPAWLKPKPSDMKNE
ncbi:F-box protein At2g17036-like [Cornus florida]|uniref:F-box protein At2g17036-like n=1 Tax=Cornus florida TaxID=4283 RepID=UPI002897F60A|nr:F-box protein At2g17036-like [Cornus florida]